MTWVAYEEKSRTLFGAFETREAALEKYPGATVFEVQPRRLPKIERCPTCGRPRVPQLEEDLA
jgi:hypothetical protein